jgi:outer membrane protein
MKNSILKRILLSVALSSVMTVTAAAQAKIAVVDMKKAFDSFFKTKQAEAQIKERAADSDKVYKGMIEDYKKASAEYRTLIDSSNDQAVSEQEREKRKKSAETKLLDLQEIEKSVKQYETQARTSIGEMEKRMREKIVGEIREVVNRLSRNGGFTMVLDVAAVTAYQTPIILYTDGQNDLTEAVIREINATAPPGTLSSTTDTKAGEKK